MSMIHEEMKWRRAASKPEVTGWDFAINAEQVADFIASVRSFGDEYTTDDFGSYVEKMARAFKFNERPENFSLLTNLNLHNITCGSMDMVEFLFWLEQRNHDNLLAAHAAL